jgi:hypothetical protein
MLRKILNTLAEFELLKGTKSSYGGTVTWTSWSIRRRK